VAVYLAIQPKHVSSPFHSQAGGVPLSTGYILIIIVGILASIPVILTFFAVVSYVILALVLGAGDSLSKSSFLQGVYLTTRSVWTRRQPDFPSYERYTRALAEYRLFAEQAERQRLNEEAQLRNEIAARERVRKCEEEKQQRERQGELRRKLEWWQTLDGSAFEREVAELFRGRGYDVEIRGGPGDEGIDLILRKAGGATLVQCKAHAGDIGVGPVRELYGTMMHHGAGEAWLVATGGFSSGAEDFAANKAIRLRSISEIIQETSGDVK